MWAMTSALAGGPADPARQAAHRDDRVHAALVPYDRWYRFQWNLWEAAGIRAESAWDVTTGLGVRVAVLDTGIVPNVDLDGNIVAGYDFIADAVNARDGNGRDADATDPGDSANAGECGPGTPARYYNSWRGTKVAGIIAAIKDYEGIIGVAHHAKVMPVRVAGKCGAAVADIADAITWASGGTVAGVPTIANPVEVIALGMTGSGACDPGLQAAIDAAVASGVVVVARAGDGNVDAALSYPGNCAHVIDVASLTRRGERAPYSNHGPVVDVAAPGGSGGGEDYGYGIYPTSASDAVESRGGELAMAHVAGVVALMQSAHANAPDVVEGILKRTAAPLMVACPEGCGAGAVDASVAVRAAQQPVVFVTAPNDLPEGDERTHPVEFQVRLSQPLDVPVTFDIATVDGTAHAVADYVPKSATAQVIPAGETAYSFSVLVKGDTLAEQHETFYVDLANVVGAQDLDAPASTRILTDECPVLENGVTLTGLSGSAGSDTCYQVTAPAYATGGVKFATTGGPYLYVRAGTLPDPRGGYWIWDCNGSSCTLYPYFTTTYYVVLHGYSAYTGATLQASYTPPPPPDLTVADAVVLEGKQGTQYLKFNVQLSSSYHADVSFDIATTDIEAQSGSDYTGFAPTAIMIPPGDDVRTIRVPISGDVAVEANETFAFRLENVVGANVIDGDAVGTILNDDGPLLRISEVGLAEGDAGTRVATFTVAINKVAAEPVVFDVATRDAGATAGSDYVALDRPGESIPAGQLARTFSVTILGDTTVEGNEQIALDLRAVSGATIVDGDGVIDILNDDGPTLSVLDAMRSEGTDYYSHYMPVTVRLSEPAAVDVTYNLWILPGTATADDFVSTSAIAGRIPAGSMSETLAIGMKSDSVVEPDETFTMELRGLSGATRFDWRAVGTILNDDGAALYVRNAVVTEGNEGTRIATFVVALSQAQSFPVSYTIATRDGTAKAGSDYVARTLVGETIPSGMLSRTFSVTINGDTDLEANEAFSADLSAVSTGIATWNPTGTATIVNDDGPALSVLDASAPEGNAPGGTMNVTLHLSQAAAVPVTYSIATTQGSAWPYQDYQETSLAGLVIPAGETTQVVSIPIVGDAAPEGNETFFVNLGVVSGATRADWQAVATIYNDDGPTLSVSDATISEGNVGTRTATFTVSLSKAAPAPVTYSVATFDGSAKAGSDYVASALANETIPAGMLSRTFAVTINGDVDPEANETFLVAVTRPSAGTTLFRNKGTGTITNDD